MSLRDWWTFQKHRFGWSSPRRRSSRVARMGQNYPIGIGLDGLERREVLNATPVFGLEIPAAMVASLETPVSVVSGETDFSRSAVDALSVDRVDALSFDVFDEAIAAVTSLNVTMPSIETLALPAAIDQLSSGLSLSISSPLEILEDAISALAEALTLDLLPS